MIILLTDKVKREYWLQKEKKQKNLSAALNFEIFGLRNHY